MNKNSNGMNPEEPKDFKKEEHMDSLDMLKENLYSRRGYFPPEKSHNVFRHHDIEIRKNWGEKVLQAKRQFSDPAERMSFLKKFFIVSAVFFLISIAVAFYVFFRGGNIISSNNVDISITGPVAVAGGEVLPLEISVVNQNNTSLESADLIIEYPEGTRDALDMTVPLKRYRESLGSMAKAGVVTKKVKAVLFGEEGGTKEILISVEYRVKGSNAIFRKEKPYVVAISSAPVSMTITSVKEINSGQEAEVTVEVVSNATAIIQNLALSAEYPFGFTFKESEPRASWSNSFWQIGDLKPGAKRTIKIRGSITGQESEDRTFRFSVGTENPANENAIGTNFLSSTGKITIRKPFIGATLTLDGDAAETHVAKAGKSIRADLTLSNNAGAKITDIKVSIRPVGEILDPASVSVSSGFYRSADRNLLWDQTLRPNLAVLNPDETVTLSFSLSTLSEQALRSIHNPEMDMVVDITGKRQDEAGISRDVASKVSTKVRIPSSLGLSTRALYYTGPFTNTGPIPPKAEADTSYTIVWALTNGSSDLGNVKVSAILPSYVKWLNVTAPSEEKITYNPIGGQVLWDVGVLKAGTGFNGSPREVNFQVSLAPSSTQVNSTPTLVSDATASGEDGFAEVTIQVGSRFPLSTELTTDIGFKQGQGTVVK